MSNLIEHFAFTPTTTHNTSSCSSIRVRRTSTPHGILGRSRRGSEGRVGALPETGSGAGSETPRKGSAGESPLAEVSQHLYT
jgi:hypothetical protein